MVYKSSVNSGGSGGGVTSLNSLTGGLSLTSTGATITITPSGSTINLEAASGSGTVTTTGTPASGNLTKFSGATSITNGDLSGDVTTSGTLATTVAKIAGVAVGTPTGTTNVVFSNAPTLSNPIVGTQASSDNSTKAASTAYVTTAITNALNGLDWKPAVGYATTANVVGTNVSGVFTYTSTGVDTIDGHTLALNDVVLFKNQTTQADNGVWVVTTAGAVGVAGVLTRRSDYNTASEIHQGDTFYVVGGTANANTSWVQTSVVNTINSDALTFSQVAGPGSYVAGNGISLTGNSFAIDTSITVDKTTAQTLTNKTLTSPILTTPALGTPASGVLTNCTGTASGLTAGAVTNATFTTALTVNTGTLTLTANAANTSVLTIGAGAVSISGANTGDQTITLTGAVTGSGTGSFATTIATPGTLTVSSTNSTATAHTHAITSSSAPGAAASILATDSSGIIGSTGTRIVKGWFTDLTVTNAITGSVTGNAATATALQNARTIGGVSFDGTANITVSSATGGFAVSGGTLTAAAQTNTGILYLNGGVAESAVFSNGNSGTSKALNLDNGNLQSLTITGAVTIALTTPTHPGKFTVIITQDGTGHVYSISGVKFPGGTAPSYSTAASKIDVISLIYDGTNWYGMGGIAFS